MPDRPPPAQAENQSSKPRAIESSSPQNIAAYVGQMSSELALMARASGLGLLAHLLDMASLEATAAAKRFDASE